MKASDAPGKDGLWTVMAYPGASRSVWSPTFESQESAAKSVAVWWQMTARTFTIRCGWLVTCLVLPAAWGSSMAEKSKGR